MGVDIHSLIAAINPDLYCDSSVKSEVKKIVKEELKKENPNAYLKAAQKAKPVSPSYLDEEVSQIGYKDALEKEGLKAPVNSKVLEYDAFGESLEPIYFWLLDSMSGMFAKVEKLSDNFTASPGSAYHSEMGMKQTRMQEEAMKMFAQANTVLRSILNLVYDMKEMRLVLDSYERYYNAKSDVEKQSGLFALKQRWMDQVDIKRGTSSLKGYVQQLDYVTIIDAFMVVDDLEGVVKLDLNDRVKRIIQQRIPEFFKWAEESHKELSKRYEIEKSYLKSQVNSLKLYSRWAKPYLKAAKAMEQTLSPDASLVATFNTVLMELMLVGIGRYDPTDDNALPQEIFGNAKLRTYNPVLTVKLNFRSMPERIQQGQQSGYGFRGKVEVGFRSYSLNDDEIKILKDQMDRDDFDDMFGAISGSTDDSIGEIQGDIDILLGDKDEEGMGEDKEEKSEDSNPFSALFGGMFGFLKSMKKESKPFEVGDWVKKDDDLEEVARSQAIMVARKNCDDLYTAYKKAHQMITPP